MEKFIVFGKYCENAIVKREPFRKQHLDRLGNLKERNILVTLGPTKCTKYLFGIFNANNKNELREIVENIKFKLPKNLNIPIILNHENNLNNYITKIINQYGEKLLILNSLK